MNEFISKERETKSINTILVAIAFIIFGTLGIIFVTQMELHPGWSWEDLREIYALRIDAFETDDMSGDGRSDILVYGGVVRNDTRAANNTPQYGCVFLLNGRNGAHLWKKEFTTPVKRVFQINDANSDGFNDFFVYRAMVAENFTGSEYNLPDILPNMSINHIISGKKEDKGATIPILTGDGVSFTNIAIIDLISHNNILDNEPDLLALEAEHVTAPFLTYNFSISSYFINGTKNNSTYIESFWVDLNQQNEVPAIDLLTYDGDPHLLYISGDSIRLFNLSSTNYMKEIYNEPMMGDLMTFRIVEDLTSDDIPEILTISRPDQVNLINGSDGTIIRSFTLPYEIDSVNLHEVPTTDGDGTIMYMFVSRKWDSATELNHNNIEIYSIDISSQILEWSQRSTDERGDISATVLDKDFDGDSVNEIIYTEQFRPMYAMERISRYRILSFKTNQVFGILNLEYEAYDMETIGDFDQDGGRDFLVIGDGRVAALAAKKPIGIWLSTESGLGLPLFIALTVILAIGVILLIVKSRDLKMSRKEIRASIKKTKLTVFVNVLVLILMTLCFILFLIQLNIFNNTLISNHQMTNLIIVFISVIILWYTILPLTAAVYNQFAPQFAFIFINLRRLFFKISRGYNHEILVTDMGERKEINIIAQMKRIILPLLLSITVGFWIYNTFSPILGVSQSFETFGSVEFFSFIIGYVQLCLLPMILSFLIFSFFISGNFLLDDAGIVYFKESKKYRVPGDIEPISIWAQSMVKGVAGLSALITFGTFFQSVDFSGFFRGDNIMFLIFGILIVFVMFWGAPFLTGFSYILLASEVMEYTVNHNTYKLYKLMEKRGYDVKPKKLTSIYPSGYKPSEKESPK
ncbi:MAG: hypothetical protein ACFFE4_03125 [Candidatus Thorarchaeota archaeon]